MDLNEQELYGKSSQELTSLLYTSGIEKLEQAIEAIKRKDYLRANLLLQKVNNILYRLGAGLNYDAGIVADQFEALYNYMANQIIIANLQKNIPTIEQVLFMLKTIAHAWDEAGLKNNAQPLLIRKEALSYQQDFIPQTNQNINDYIK